MPRERPCPIGSCSDEVPEGHLVCRSHAIYIWRKVQLSIPSKYADESVAQREDRLWQERARLERDRQHPGWIYYLRLDEKIKIGWTSDLNQRIKAYPPHAEVLASHPGTRADERDLHRSFKPFRVAGREWYSPGGELMSHIRRQVVVVEDPVARIQADLAAKRAEVRPKLPPIPPGTPHGLTGRAFVRAVMDGRVTE